MTHRFNVFGRVVAIRREGEVWICQQLGADGKARPMELAIPPDLAQGELAQYLYDIYHESATPTNGDVVEIVAP